jgi:hypothetical protein
MVNKTKMMITAENPLPTVLINTTGKLRTCDCADGRILSGSLIGDSMTGTVTTIGSVCGTETGCGDHPPVADTAEGVGSTTGGMCGHAQGGACIHGDRLTCPIAPPTADTPPNQSPGPLWGRSVPKRNLTLITPVVLLLLAPEPDELFVVELEPDAVVPEEL